MKEFAPRIVSRVEGDSNAQEKRVSSLCRRHDGTIKTQAMGGEFGIRKARIGGQSPHRVWRWGNPQQFHLFGLNDEGPRWQFKYLSLIHIFATSPD